MIYDNVYKYREMYDLHDLESRLFSLTAWYSAIVSNKCLFALFAHEMRFSARYLVDLTM